MKFPRLRLSVRWTMIVIAVAAVLMYYVVMPIWSYYSLPKATRDVLAGLSYGVQLPTSGKMPFGDFIKTIRTTAFGQLLTNVPIYVDPAGLQEAGVVDLQIPVDASPDRISLKDQLERSLKPLGLGYFVKDGLLTITSAKVADRTLKENPTEARRP